MSHIRYGNIIVGTVTPPNNRSCHKRRYADMTIGTVTPINNRQSYFTVQIQLFGIATEYKKSAKIG